MYELTVNAISPKELKAIDSLKVSYKYAPLNNSSIWHGLLFESIDIAEHYIAKAKEIAPLVEYIITRIE